MKERLESERLRRGEPYRAHMRDSRNVLKGEHTLHELSIPARAAKSEPGFGEAESAN